MHLCYTFSPFPLTIHTLSHQLHIFYTPYTNNTGAASPHQPSAHPTPQRVAAAPSGRENAPPAGHAAGVPGQQTSVQDGGVSSQHTSPPKAAVKPLAAPAQGACMGG